MNSRLNRFVLFFSLFCLAVFCGRSLFGGSICFQHLSNLHLSGDHQVAEVLNISHLRKSDTIKNLAKKRESGRNRATDHHIRLAMNRQNTGKVVCVPGKEQAKVIDGYSVNSFEGSQIQVLVNAPKNKIIVKGVTKGRLYIFTCMGKQVFFGKLRDNIELDITSLLDGCYNLKVEREGQVYSKQIIIRR